MMTGKDVFVTGIGAQSPGDPIPFDQIESVLGELTDIPPKLKRWETRMKPIMQEMLGIDYTHYALDPKTGEPFEDNVTLSSKAARLALAEAQVEVEEIDLVVFAGISMEYACPPTSVLIQEELKIPFCADYAIHSNCSSIYKAIQLASDMVANGRYTNALICTSQLSSAFLRASYFNQPKMTKTHVLLRWFLCDGSGALVITSDPKPGTRKLRVIDTYVESAGLGLGPDMYCKAGGFRTSPLEMYEHAWHHLAQNFDNVARLAPILGRQAMDNMVKHTGIDLNTVKWFFANVPTKHLSDEVVESLRDVRQLPNMKFYTKLAEKGYAGPCAILQALDGFFKEQTPEPGDILMSMVTESSKWMHGGWIFEYLGT